MDDDIKYLMKVIGIPLVFGVAFLWLWFNFVNPYMHVWHESMIGKAELSRAESNRQIATLEALAKKESAKSLADAEVIRAEGVAKANKIIGTSLQNNEGYLRYLWILGLQTNNMSVVYIPTEANLPILESTRWTEERHIKRN